LAPTVILILDDFSCDWHPIFGPHLFNDSEVPWRLGELTCFATSKPHVTFTTIPVPSARNSNSALQERILESADIFLLVLHTSFRKGDDTGSWLDDLPWFTRSHPDTPVICWINREEKEFTDRSFVEAWEKSERERYLNMYTCQLSHSKLKKQEIEEKTRLRRLRRLRIRLTLLYPQETRFPIYSELRRRVNSTWSDSPIFDVDLES